MLEPLLLMLLAPDAAALPQCGKEPINGAVDRYATAVRVQDIAAVAGFYGDTGTLLGAEGEAITGKKAVADYMGQLSGYHVVAEQMMIDQVAAIDAGWSVAGRFAQRGTTPDGGAYAVQGGFDSRWSCQAGQWQIDRFAIRPKAAPVKDSGK